MSASTTVVDDELQMGLQKLDALGNSWACSDSYLDLYRLWSARDEYSTNSELLWRLARAAYQLAQKRNLDHKLKMELIEDGLLKVRRSLEINDRCAQSCKWYSMLIGEHALSGGFVEKAHAALTINKFIAKALEQDPLDAMAYHVRATLCFSIASLNVIQRQGIKLLFSEFPNSSFEEVIQLFEKAESISPSAAKALHILNAAKAYIQTSQINKALPLLHRIEGMSIVTEDDELRHKEARKLLQTLKKCCDNSSSSKREKCPL